MQNIEIMINVYLKKQSSFNLIMLNCFQIFFLNIFKNMYFLSKIYIFFCLKWNKPLYLWDVNWST